VFYNIQSYDIAKSIIAPFGSSKIIIIIIIIIAPFDSSKKKKKAPFDLFLTPYSWFP